MASGIKVTDEVKDVYRRICLLPKKEEKLRFAVFKFLRQKEHVDLKIQFTSEDVPKNEQNERHYPTIDQLIGGLPSEDVRYILYDVGFLTKEEIAKDQVVLISWHPQCSSVKAKLICGSSFIALRQTLGVTKYYVEADCFNEACGDALVEKFGYKVVVNSAEAPDDIVPALFALESSCSCMHS